MLMEKKCMSKYDFTPAMARTGIDLSEVVTVPDQVLSMYDIYMKYSVRGEIAGLANNILPTVTDNFDDFDDAVGFVPEESVDILQRSKSIRMAEDAKASSKSANPAVEDKPQEREESESSPTKPQEPAPDPAESVSGSD